MKILVFLTLAVFASAKPKDKPLEKRQLDDLSGYLNSGGQFRTIETQSQNSGQILNQASNGYNLGLTSALSSPNGAAYDLSYLRSSINNVQPEITNLGNSGLNSNGFISTTTAAPISANSFGLPTSTISPLAYSGINSVSSLPVGASSGVSDLFSQGVLSSVTPLPDISSTFSSSSFNSFPTAAPILSSTAIPSSLLNTRFGANDFILDNTNFQGIDLSSLNLNNLNSINQQVLSVQPNVKSEVSKSVYFYEAPEEPEPIRQRKIVQLPPQKTNYKLLFIKAPAAPEPQPIEIPAQTLNNEKTRVYVLVKKPETEQVVRVVAGPTPKPEKPEVFYIKYKTREEAEKAIQDAQAGANLGQESISVDGRQLVSSIKDNKLISTGGNFVVKQTIPSVPLNLYASSTPLPFLSTTGSLGNLFESSTVNSLLNGGNLNQLSVYNTPVLSSGSNYLTPSNELYQGSLGFRSNNFGSFRTNSLGSNSFGTSGFSNFPSFVDLSRKNIFQSRSGRIDDKEVKTNVPVPQPDNNFVSTSDGSISENSKDEPFQLRIGGTETSTTSSIFTNSVEPTSSTTEKADNDSTTVSE